MMQGGSHINSFKRTHDSFALSGELAEIQHVQSKQLRTDTTHWPNTCTSISQTMDKTDMMETEDIQQANEGGDEKKALFPELQADDADDNPVTEMESLCMRCYKNGITRLMLTKIPFFKEVIISSFECESCGYANREIQSGGRIQDYGVRYSFIVKNKEDLNRQVVKSEHATFAIPELQFEQPPSGKGIMSTIEGLISAVILGLQQDQPQRKVETPEVAEKIDAFIEKMEQVKSVNTPFHFILDDPSGNSYLENPFEPKKDETCTVEHYTRNAEQNEKLGIQDEPNEPGPASTENVGKDEVLTFSSNCSNCNAPCDTNMKVVDIPFFKEVVIMASSCDSCGLRNNEVKGGAGIADKGTLIKLKITDTSDLSRDVLKSDTCGLKIPELELELEHGTLGGKFTTVEGLLTNIRTQLQENNPFVTGDSAADNTKSKLTQFCERLEEVIQGRHLNVHLILDDPAGNSYLQNVYAPDPDPEMEVIHYERSEEQRELLGLNDMNVDNYLQES